MCLCVFVLFHISVRVTVQVVFLIVCSMCAVVCSVCVLALFWCCCVRCCRCFSPLFCMCNVVSLLCSVASVCAFLFFVWVQLCY